MVPGMDKIFGLLIIRLKSILILKLEYIVILLSLSRKKIIIEKDFPIEEIIIKKIELREYQLESNDIDDDDDDDGVKDDSIREQSINSIGLLTMDLSIPYFCMLLQTEEK